ncbi:MAG: hypothetical protein K2O45_03805, partial [Oscillospiraceae bacterium]|nr:hypothetical protein [Oscillospiraceae bacterium]
QCVLHIAWMPRIFNLQHPIPDFFHLVHPRHIFMRRAYGEVPEHWDFIYGRAIPVLESMGVT